MTEEEFLKEYKGKFIRISAEGKEEIAWIFDVLGADFSLGNGLFTGWISGKKCFFGRDDRILTADDDVVLRPEDKITVFKDEEELGKDIQAHLNEMIKCS